MSFPLLTFGCLGVGGVYMSWSDLTRRRLPNTAAAILALAGLLGGGLMLGTQHAFSSLLHLLIALGIGICAFALNLVAAVMPSITLRRRAGFRFPKRFAYSVGLR